MKMNNMKFLIPLFILIALNASAEDTLKEISYNFAKINIGKGKPVFLEFGSKECPSCKIMGESLYEIKEDNPNYNINYINIYSDRRVIEKFDIQAIPMQIIYDKSGKEVYKNVGLIKKDELNKLFKTYKF